MRARLTTSERHDEFLSENPADDAETLLDQQARAKLIMCLSNDMLPLVEETDTARAAYEAVRADHLGNARSMRSELLAEVAAMKQSHRQSVKDYVAVGREYLVRLREVGVERPATLLIPTFKAGISHQLKQQVLPLLKQTAFDNDLRRWYRNSNASPSGCMARKAMQAKRTSLPVVLLRRRRASG